MREYKDFIYKLLVTALSPFVTTIITYLLVSLTSIKMTPELFLYLLGSVAVGTVLICLTLILIINYKEKSKAKERELKLSFIILQLKQKEYEKKFKRIAVVLSALRSDPNIYTTEINDIDTMPEDTTLHKLALEKLDNLEFYKKKK